MKAPCVTIEVGNPTFSDVRVNVEFILDSGITYSVVPTDVLERLKIKSLGTQELILANGKKIRRKKGIALLQYGRRLGGATVLFGRSGDKRLLGSTSLEALGLGFDPLKGRLLPLALAL